MVDHINNGEEGFSVREKLNTVIDRTNTLNGIENQVESNKNLSQQNKARIDKEIQDRIAGDSNLQGQVNDLESSKSDKGHTHPISDIIDLQDELDGKQPVGDYVTEAPDDGYQYGRQLQGGVMTWTVNEGGAGGGAGAGMIIDAEPPPPEDREPGLQWMDEDTGMIWIWDGVRWLEFPASGQVGPKGEKGDRGEQGLAGEDGADGASADLSAYSTTAEADSKYQPKGDYLTDFTELDPTVPQHVKDITEAQITEWDSAGGASGSLWATEFNSVTFRSGDDSAVYIYDTREAGMFNRAQICLLNEGTNSGGWIGAQSDALQIGRVLGSSPENPDHGVKTPIISLHSTNQCSIGYWETPPTDEKLYVNGTARFVDSVTVKGELLSAKDDAGANAFRAGPESAVQTQGESATAVGHQAGQYRQGANATAIGYRAGGGDQGPGATAVGPTAGQITQGEACTAVGYGAGTNQQKNGAVAIGNLAGNYYQGQCAIAIGKQAGRSNQSQYSICINSSGENVNPTSSGQIVIKSTTHELISTPIGFAMNGEPIIGARKLMSTLSTLRNATKDETTLEGMRDALADAIGGIIERLEHEIATMPAEVSE